MYAIINPTAIPAANLVRLPTVVSLLRIILSMLGQMLPADHRCGWTLRSATMRIGVAMHSFNFEAYSNIPMMARCLQFTWATASHAQRLRNSFLHRFEGSLHKSRETAEILHEAVLSDHILTWSIFSTLYFEGVCSEK